MKTIICALLAFMSAYGENIRTAYACVSYPEDGRGFLRGLQNRVIKG